MIMPRFMFQPKDTPEPVLKGGQGRTPEDLECSAWLTLIGFGVAVLVYIVALAANLSPSPQKTHIVSNNTHAEAACVKGDR